MQNDLFDAVEADRLKEEGKAASAEKHARALGYARAIARQVATDLGQVTVDQVYDRLRYLGFNDWALGNAAGSIFKGKSWEFTGEWRKSKRTTNHGRYVRVWRLKA